MSTGTPLYEYSPNQAGIIQGLGDRTVIPMMSDIDIIYKKPIHNADPVPTITYTMSVTTIKSFTYLVDGSTTTYKARNFISIPPFIFEEINDSPIGSNGDAKAALVQIFQCMKSFDAIHAQDNNYIKKYNKRANIYCTGCIFSN